MDWNLVWQVIPEIVILECDVCFQLRCQFWNIVPNCVKERIGLTFENDGEFYMNFNLDFLKYFGEIEVVHVNPTNIECTLRDWTKTFDVFHLFGKWEDETAKGGVDGSLGSTE
jgi:hypothetical protein